ncbi:hypothetical protein YA22_20720 [Klebsiella aerogenes]|nr:hypothetical protein YA22_20720 [Klebsiella aerogenes]
MNRYQFPEGFFGGLQHQARRQKASRISRTVLSGIAGMQNNPTAFSSRLVRRKYVKPTASIKRTLR